ncbi:hypothetical protein HYP97_gp17 [Klebsiella phage KpCHEMY26]|uniref:Uncharacterized protein n=1 Tax=Klebsiella phage KpCHEMY26 TaxID=2596966 RepID=A0A5B8R7Q2_9CAUD|nr:hypothetical protein HYP97_gp17 [Klebsiella phage KpCHEMY26]QEA03375.1 hypothetical protein [Klebsiella phage KpCHEMY26]
MIPTITQNRNHTADATNQNNPMSVRSTMNSNNRNIFI